MDLAVLQTLIYRSELFKSTQKHYYLFAKTGFAKGCVKLASERSDINLVSFDDMMKKFRK